MSRFGRPDLSLFFSCGLVLVQLADKSVKESEMSPFSAESKKPYRRYMHRSKKGQFEDIRLAAAAAEC
jgi:hypothetical protein